MKDADVKIVIQSRKNHTWQGSVELDGNTLSFRSELELLRLINAGISKSEPCRFEARPASAEDNSKAKKI